MRWFFFMAILLAIASCGQVEEDSLSDADVEVDAGRFSCRGVASLRCPVGMLCVDVVDSCRPELGDMDCVGECIDADTGGFK